MIIQHDWEKIARYVKEGKAHELSERDFMYLSPARKGSGGDEKVKYNDKYPKAKPRAYSFKKSYMTKLFNERMITKEEKSYILPGTVLPKEKEFDDIFDDDFEVTYEEDPVYDEDDFDNGKFYETDDSDEDDSEENYFEEEYPGDEYPDEAAENEYDDAIYSPSDRKRKKRHPSEEEPEYETGKRSDPRSRKRSGVPLAAPIKKGGKALSRLTGFLLQQLSVLLILATTIFVLYNFWRASTPYGDIQESIRKKSISQTLAAYLCIAAIFLFFEFISLIWTMTRVRVRENERTIKEDTGRGLFSFLLVFITSYLCFLFSHFLPDSPEIIYGIKGAFDVYGSLHNALLGLCAAGVISCLIRRHMS